MGKGEKERNQVWLLGFLPGQLGNELRLGGVGEGQVQVCGWNEELCSDKLSGRNLLVIHLGMSSRQLDMRVGNTRLT